MMAVCYMGPYFALLRTKYPNISGHPLSRPKVKSRVARSRRAAAAADYKAAFESVGRWLAGVGEKSPLESKLVNRMSLPAGAAGRRTAPGSSSRRFTPTARAVL